LALAFLAFVSAMLCLAAAFLPANPTDIPSGSFAWLQALPVAVATCLLILIVLRLGRLYRTWLRRQAGRAGPYMPFEVRIRGGNAIAKVEQPLGLRLLISLLVVGFILLILLGANAVDPAGYMDLADVVFVSWSGLLLISLRWWYRINRELRDLDNIYGSRHASGRPLVSLLMMAAVPAGYLLSLWIGAVFVIFPLIAIFRLGRHIQRAQARAGQRRKVLSPWILAPALVLGPLLFAYIQKQMNKIWAAQGQLLDPSPAASWEVNWSTGTLPWLRAPIGRTTHPAGACLPSMPPAWIQPNGTPDGADGGIGLGRRENVAPSSPLDKTVTPGEGGSNAKHRRVSAPPADLPSEPVPPALSAPFLRSNPSDPHSSRSPSSANEHRIWPARRVTGADWR
jgi:hypothetical protein